MRTIKNFTRWSRAGVWCAVVLLCQAAGVRAEYPALETALKPALEKIANVAKGLHTIVVVRDHTQTELPWRVRAAVQTEITAGLLTRHIKAVEIELEPDSAWLLSKPQAIATEDVTRWKRTTAFDALVLGQLLKKGDGLEVKLVVHRQAQSNPTIIPPVVLDASTYSLAANIPALNQKVVEFVQQHVGQQIGDGEGTAVAAAAIKEAGAKSRRIYHWGRQLGHYEALLPGDIFQVESAKWVDNKGMTYRTVWHQTLVLEEVVSPDVVRVLQQNAGTAGKTVSRTIYKLDEVKSGLVTAYRPTDGSSPLPISLFPRRRIAPHVESNAAGRIDLLEAIDPELDSVHGLWHRRDGALASQRDVYTRLQIPVDIPQSYTIQATVKRCAGGDQFGFGLVVEKRQVMLVLDSYGGKVSGLHLLDGKKVYATTQLPREVLLPIDVVVKLKVAVTPKSIELFVDGKSKMKWDGQPQQLSLQSDFEVPHKEWLFLTSQASQFEVTELILDPN